MKELRQISTIKIIRICIENDFYTDGDYEDYNNMLTFASSLKNATTDDLEKIASDIKKHSETDCEIEDIMFSLANDCCKIYFIKNK